MKSNPLRQLLNVCLRHTNVKKQPWCWVQAEDGGSLKPRYLQPFHLLMYRDYSRCDQSLFLIGLVYLILKT